MNYDPVVGNKLF